jgi:hypothetical protein
MSLSPGQRRGFFFEPGNLWKRGHMRLPIIAATVTALLLVPIVSEAKNVRDPGGGFIGQKRSKVGKNYYVVRQGSGCAIKAGKLEEKPDGVVGDAPYASKKYAKTALKSFPECKGGEVSEDVFTGKKHRKK